MVAVAAAFRLPVHRTARVNAVLFLALAAYAVYLARLNRKPLRTVSGPLSIVAAAAATAGSIAAFALPAAAALAWIRSDICCSAAGRWKWSAELAAGAGGLVLAGLLCELRPGPYGWAAGVWGFGLAQAGYFAWCEGEGSIPEAHPAPDRLARLQLRAGAVLKEQRLEKAFRDLGL
jgi:hypothetical protein